MNDIVLLTIISVVVCLFLAYFLWFNIYGGVYGSLTSARVGDVYNFRYFQPVMGTYKRYLAKIVKIRKLEQHELSILNWTSNYRMFDKTFKRTPTLVTCLMGDGTFRQFYAERSDMVKRSFFGGLLFRAGIAHLF